MTTRNLGLLAEKINYQFNNIQLLEEALRHSSYVNEQQVAMPDNERFEFLGDAVLSLIIGHILFQKYPDLNEGDLSLIRSNLVNESQLADIACSLKLGDYLQLGKGETHTNGKGKKSILANAFEALIAAIYLDGGFKAAFEIVEKNFSSIICSVTSASSVHYCKTRLQELVQSTHHAEIPHYTIINEIGPDHEKTFTAQLKVGRHITQGTGKSKKLAEQDAAKKALEIINKEGF
jgi:ribonuclease-3